ncbi:MULTISPECIES: DUF6791 domain-containing protein [unclassified Mesorhizobium]|uniref:DUF6791 domain-containing protein n=1 Tax=unclassified Mesorhizobium TaxID=325217 RepID=UPI0032AEE5E0
MIGPDARHPRRSLKRRLPLPCRWNTDPGDIARGRRVRPRHGLKATHAFSSKPDCGYTDYHHKMTSYVNMIAGPAAVVKAGATPRTFREPEPEEDSVFNYVETASDRVGIGALRSGSSTSGSPSSAAAAPVATSVSSSARRRSAKSGCSTATSS